MKKTKTTTATETITAKVYPAWQKPDTRAAADRMNDAQFALCEARDAWVAAGKPETEEHKVRSKMLQDEVDRTTREFSLLSRRDLSSL